MSAAIQGNSEDYTISNIQIGIPASTVETPKVSPEATKPVTQAKKETVKKMVPAAPKKAEAPKKSVQVELKPAPGEVIKTSVPNETTSSAQVLKSDVGQVFMNGVTSSQNVMSSATIPSVFSGSIMFAGEGEMFKVSDDVDYNLFLLSVVVCMSAALILMGYKLAITNQED